MIATTLLLLAAACQAQVSSLGPSEAPVVPATLATSSLITTSSALPDPGNQNPQYNPTRYVTADGYWHNRFLPVDVGLVEYARSYHGLLAMAAYGNYNQTCPWETFTEESKLRNFPNSQRAPWTVLETWDTPSGCSGFSAIVPEMNKALLVFKGNLHMEQNLPTDIVPWSFIGINDTCEDCTMNAFAAQGYLEAKNATNNWEITRNAYYNSGLVFSIVGHGLGGMHSLIAAVDLNYQNICYYHHALGTPRTFNLAGASWYNWKFNGEAGERGVFGGDTIGEIIPPSENYTHAGTTFLYWGYNSTSTGMNWRICWLDEGGPDQAACQPDAENSDISALQAHYFTWTDVGDCGASRYPDVSDINAFLANNQTTLNVTSITAAPAASSSAAVSSAVVFSSIPTDSAIPTFSGQVQAAEATDSSGATRSGILSAFVLGLVGLGAHLL